MDDLMWYKIFIVKFQMYACDTGDGNFILYVNEYQHWTFPKHIHKRFVSLNALFPEVESQQPQMENDYLRQIFLHSSYLVQNTREFRKLVYCVWARLLKRTDNQCLCTCLSDQWLCNNWVNATLDLWSRRADPFPVVSHICVVNWVRATGSALVQVMAGCLFGAKSLPKVILAYCQLHTWE